MAETPNMKVGFDMEMPDWDEAFRPVRLIAIGAEGTSEVTRARGLHGPNSDLLYGTGPAAESIAKLLGIGRLVSSGPYDNRNLEKHIKAVNDYGMTHGRIHTRAGVLLKEVVEAIATRNDDDLRTELIQVIAMAMDWVDDIDKGK